MLFTFKPITFLEKNHENFIKTEISKLREKYLDEDKKQPGLLDFSNKN